MVTFGTPFWAISEQYMAKTRYWLGLNPAGPQNRGPKKGSKMTPKWVILGTIFGGYLGHPNRNPTFSGQGPPNPGPGPGPSWDPYLEGIWAILTGIPPFLARDPQNRGQNDPQTPDPGPWAPGPDIPLDLGSPAEKGGFGAIFGPFLGPFCPGPQKGPKSGLLILG